MVTIWTQGPASLRACSTTDQLESRAAVKSLCLMLISLMLAPPALAQAPAQDASSAPIGTNILQETQAPIPPVTGTLVAPPLIEPYLGAQCIPAGTRDLPAGASVVVMKRFECRPTRPGKAPVDLVHAFYNGEAVFLRESNVRISIEGLQRLSTITDSVIEASYENWKSASASSFQGNREAAMAEVRKTSAQGVALLDHSVFDVSEVTQGTGFKVSLLNTGKKTIKYITFSVVGLNAVEDPVRDRLTGSTTVALRGVGPIEPLTTATYSKDYMWMTDLVEYHRITGIAIQYMDGSTKKLTNLKQLNLDVNVAKTLGLN